MMQDTEDAPVELRAAGAARVLHVLGDQVALRGALGGTGMEMVDVSVPPGSGVPPHRHASPETFRVLAGRLTLAREGAGGGLEELEAGPGDIIAIPSRTLHGYRNAGTETAVFTVVLEPSLVAFFEAAAAPQPMASPPAPEVIARIMALANAHGIEMQEAA